MLICIVIVSLLCLYLCCFLALFNSCIHLFMHPLCISSFYCYVCMLSFSLSFLLSWLFILACCHAFRLYVLPPLFMCLLFFLCRLFFMYVVVIYLLSCFMYLFIPCLFHCSFMPYFYMCSFIHHFRHSFIISFLFVSVIRACICSLSHSSLHYCSLLSLFHELCDAFPLSCIHSFVVAFVHYCLFILFSSLRYFFIFHFLCCLFLRFLLSAFIIFSCSPLFISLRSFFLSLFMSACLSVLLYLFCLSVFVCTLRVFVIF